MPEIYTQTLKYFWLAIDRFMPVLSELEKSASNKDDKEEILDLMEAYSEIQGKIGKLNLNYDDPNRRYDGEPFGVRNWLSDEMLENLSRLTLRLLVSWKDELKKLQGKKYITDMNTKIISKLENLIWPLEALSKAGGYLVGKYNSKGPLVFPGEDKIKATDHKEEIILKRTDIFSKDLISKIPPDLVILCDEFNFNFINNKPNAGMLLLRRILPLAIVRKFQILNKEVDIKTKEGDFADTKGLLGKVENLLSNKRIYKEIEGYKLLIDSSQHSYSINIDPSDVEGAAIKIRVLLDDLF